jgi:uncharacterized flavoprotein (TIGR03862 family)
MSQSLPIVIVGAGPAGLMAAEVLAQAGQQVEVYEQKPSAARKFLMAGKTGLNISHNEPFEQFISRYDQPDWLRPMVEQCDAIWIQQWMASLGIESYIGSSGRIFPKEMKAAPLLRAWIARLKQLGVTFFYRHQWLGWQQDQLAFLNAEQSVLVNAKAVILATGGGSWARLGSDAAWLNIMQQQQVDIEPLQPSNIGVERAWSNFMQPVFGQPLKRVLAWVNPNDVHQGEAVISHYGLEGGLIYKLTRALRQQMQHGEAVIYLDLLPDLTAGQLAKKLVVSGKQSLSNVWRKAGLDTAKAGLIRELVDKELWQQPDQLAVLIKTLPVPVASFRPMDEAISTAGGVALDELDHYLMLKQKAGVFCCGEMLDWDAPTGGYLLTACLATGKQAGTGVLSWLKENSPQ